MKKRIINLDCFHFEIKDNNGKMLLTVYATSVNNVHYEVRFIMSWNFAGYLKNAVNEALNKMIQKFRVMRIENESK